MKIKQQSQVTYLRYVSNETSSGELIALETLNKINEKLKFLYHKNKFLILTLSNILCMHSSSHILVIPALRGTLTLIKN